MLTPLVPPVDVEGLDVEFPVAAVLSAAVVLSTGVVELSAVVVELSAVVVELSAVVVELSAVVEVADPPPADDAAMLFAAAMLSPSLVLCNR